MSTWPGVVRTPSIVLHFSCGHDSFVGIVAGLRFGRYRDRRGPPHRVCAADIATAASTGVDPHPRSEPRTDNPHFPLGSDSGYSSPPECVVAQGDGLLWYFRGFPSGLRAVPGILGAGTGLEARETRLRIRRSRILRLNVSVVSNRRMARTMRKKTWTVIAVANDTRHLWSCLQKATDAHDAMRQCAAEMGAVDLSNFQIIGAIRGDHDVIASGEDGGPESGPR